MKPNLLLSLLAVTTLPVFAQKPDAPLPLFVTRGEALQYTVTWPSGLTLGDVMFTALPSGAGLDLDMTLDAGVPGFSIIDRFHSLTGLDLCSLELERQISHGSKKSSEKITFDYAHHAAHRVSANGGMSDVPISGNCAYDALSFLYVVRRELAQGIKIPAGQVYFGSVYSLRLEYSGQQVVTISKRQLAADRVTVHLKGPASSRDFEIFFAGDPAHTPLLAKVPTDLGTISLELDIGF